MKQINYVWRGKDDGFDSMQFYAWLNQFFLSSSKVIAILLPLKALLMGGKGALDEWPIIAVMIWTMALISQISSTPWPNLKYLNDPNYGHDSKRRRASEAM